MEKLTRAKKNDGRSFPTFTLSLMQSSSLGIRKRSEDMIIVDINYAFCINIGVGIMLILKEKVHLYWMEWKGIIIILSHVMGLFC